MKKLLSLLTITSLVITSAGCTPGGESGTEPAAQTTYNIGICRDDDSDYSSLVVAGYKDALIDNFGEDSLVFIEQTASTSPSASTAVETVLQTGVDDIFTYGDNSLSSATELTNATPIIFAGVYNYEDVLHIVSDEEKTALNVTGISSKPNFDEQVSLLIEACDRHPTSVGILYDPTDNASIVQNESFEAILDTAGIPWKEYEFTESNFTDSAPSDNTGNVISADNIPLPSLSSAASGKEGNNIDIDSIGDYGDLTGVNEPMSARSAKVSALWVEPTDAAPEDGSESDAKATVDSEEVSEPPEESTVENSEDLLRLAFDQCGAIYLCRNNTLCESEDFVNDIKNLATETSTVTIGGDELIGQNTLVSLYEDPYDIGYRCGKKSIDILSGEKSTDEISIDSPSSSKTTKLYNPDLSNALGKSWPKSFHGLEEYLTSYEPGSLTDRIDIE